MHTGTRALLNIGLRSANGRCQITPGAALHELYGVLDGSPVIVLDSHKHGDVLVVELSAEPKWSAIDDLSNKLWQNNVALYDLEREEGHLLGRVLGRFNHYHFVLPNGGRLVDTILPVRRDVLNTPVSGVQVVNRGPYKGQTFVNVQPTPLHADTADFRDYGDCVLLGSLGVFHTDAKWFKAKRAEEGAAADRIDGAYHWIGLNRRAELTRIRSEVATLLGNSGIWPSSSGEYTSRRAALDEHVLRQARRLGYTS